MIVADLDEFWYVKGSTIKKQLQCFEQYNVIHSQWRMFGSDGLIEQPKDIRVSITHRHPLLNPNTKYIFQTKPIRSTQITLHTIVNEPNQIDASDVFRLNHYPIQSWEYFQKVKMRRGDASSSTVDNIRNEHYFKNHDKDTDFEDLDLQQMVMEQQKTTRKTKTKNVVSSIGLFFVILFVLFSLLFCLYLFQSTKKK